MGHCRVRKFIGGGGKTTINGFCMGSVDPIGDTQIMATTSRQFLNSVAKESGIPEELLKALFLKLFMEEQPEGVFKNIHKL